MSQVLRTRLCSGIHRDGKASLEYVEMTDKEGIARLEHCITQGVSFLLAGEDTSCVYGIRWHLVRLSHISTQYSHVEARVVPAVTEVSAEVRQHQGCRKSRTPDSKK
jgi:hypothetical protein